MAQDQGDYAAARAYLEQSLEIFREIGNRQGIADSLNGSGNVACIQGDYAASRAYHEQSLEIFREIGDRQGMAGYLEAFASLASSSRRIDALPADTVPPPKSTVSDSHKDPDTWECDMVLHEQLGRP